MKLQPHPIAQIIPQMTDAEYVALRDDIRENGLIEPIMTLDGMILDGRHRARACDEIGIEPKISEWNGSGGDPVAFVRSMNLHRRHLTFKQRVKVAAMLANMRRGRRPSDKSATLPICEEAVDSVDGAPFISVPQAAQAMGVGTRSVTDRKVVLERGTPEENEQVDSGEAAVSAVARGVRAREKRKPNKAAEKAPKSGAASSTVPNHRARLALPAGKSAEDVARAALQMKTDGKAVHAIAARFGNSSTTIGQMIDIVLIHDRADLTARDHATAVRALELMNTTATIDKPYQIISDVADKLWGPPVERKWPSRERIEAARIDRFERCLNLIMVAKQHAEEVPIPYLSAERTTEVLAELDEAKTMLTTLRNKVREART